MSLPAPDQSNSLQPVLSVSTYLDGLTGKIAPGQDPKLDEGLAILRSKALTLNQLVELVAADPGLRSMIADELGDVGKTIAGIKPDPKMVQPIALLGLASRLTDRAMAVLFPDRVEKKPEVTSVVAPSAPAPSTAPPSPPVVPVAVVAAPVAPLTVAPPTPAPVAAKPESAVAVPPAPAPVAPPKSEGPAPQTPAPIKPEAAVAAPARSVQAAPPPAAPPVREVAPPAPAPTRTIQPAPAATAFVPAESIQPPPAPATTAPAAKGKLEIVVEILSHERKSDLIAMLRTLVDLADQREKFRYGYVASRAFEGMGMAIERIAPAFEFFRSRELIVPAPMREGGKVGEYRITPKLRELSEKPSFAFTRGFFADRATRAAEVLRTSEDYQRALKLLEREIDRVAYKLQRAMVKTSLDRFDVNKVFFGFYAARGDELLNELIALGVASTVDAGKRIQISDEGWKALKLIPKSVVPIPVKPPLPPRRNPAVSMPPGRLGPVTAPARVVTSATPAAAPAPAARPILAPPPAAPAAAPRPIQSSPPAALAPAAPAILIAAIRSDVLAVLDLTYTGDIKTEMQPRVYLEGVFQDAIQSHPFQAIMRALSEDGWFISESGNVGLSEKAQIELIEYRRVEKEKADAEIRQQKLSITPTNEMIILARQPGSEKIIPALESGELSTERLGAALQVSSCLSLLQSLVALQKLGYLSSDGEFKGLPQNRVWKRTSKEPGTLVHDIAHAREWIALKTADAGTKAAENKEAAPAVAAPVTAPLKPVEAGEVAAESSEPALTRERLTPYLESLGVGAESIKRLMMYSAANGNFEKLRLKIETLTATLGGAELSKDINAALLREPALWETLLSNDGYHFLGRLASALQELAPALLPETAARLTSIARIDEVLAMTDKTTSEVALQKRHSDVLLQDVAAALRGLKTNDGNPIQFRNDPELLAKILVHGMWCRGFLRENGRHPIYADAIARMTNQFLSVKVLVPTVSSALAELQTHNFVTVGKLHEPFYRLNSQKGVSSNPIKSARAILEKISAYHMNLSAPAA